MHKSRVLGIIPARWASTRFPGKPLHPIAGKPLIQHVWDQCKKTNKLDEILIATDDTRIAESAESFGAKVVMTSDNHVSGTDRIAEAAITDQNSTHIINIQGDEPLIDPDLIDQLAEKISNDSTICMITAAVAGINNLDLANSNVVKTVIDKENNAIYFSRSVIPHQNSESPAAPCYRHKGIYGYTKDFLLKFVRWEPSPLELAERLEQLRAIENGERIHVIITDDNSIGVDTPEQAIIVEQQILANT
ncbi:MAG: 3-deoxy-manno-octulosonate cytidylyltransferase [Akkermansiaceae bacterium]|jgi:3-deoxy-manno-octulosonate cytidylyltransferase (CMP-KDO synthetase)|nr:3-deoxy-manno-octulosonate cytidylyltransferase [Akkermansiaceae bacterium]MDG1854457.1 3-deoxy-manno-octulosonate cytidylyltransferase [Verrucomicrobiales bacterium]